METSIKKWLKKRLSEILNLPIGKISEHEKFSNYGLDSARATLLSAEMKQEFGGNFLPTLFFGYPTIHELGEHLSNPKKNNDKGRKEYKTLEEPIAVVGMSCRFPKSNNPEEFWEFMIAGKDAVSEVPKSRWNMADYYDPDPKAEGKTNTKYGAFLEGDIDDFDPFFFDISPREAIEMNPSQKVILEIVWEALQNAGIPYQDLEGSKTGVFIGSVWNDFERIRLKKHAPVNQHSAVGQSPNIVANRVSYAFGFQGPSLVIDSACSSSLLAIHLACQSLQSNDSELAIAGGINLMLDPDTYVALSKFGGLSADGKCKTFDADASGYVRGEGAGVIVLKRLSDAKKNGDRILGIVKGSAVNNDGYSNGLTAPNVEAQKKVLREAYGRANILPESVNYIEAHGTGTRLGDPIEMEALASVLTEDREETVAPLKVGSVKTNIGHLEGAAGIASMIKGLMILNKHIIPKNIHFNAPNPFIPLEEYKIEVQKENETIDLPKYEPIRVGLSGFGWGGTNCHIVLEEYSDESNELFVYSADSDKGILDFLRNVKLKLKSISRRKTLKELCAEVATIHNDNNKKHRISFKIDSFRSLNDKLSDSIANQGDKYYKEVSSQPKTAFVLAPFGGQYPKMGIALYENEVIFRNKLDLCSNLFESFSGWSISDKLYTVSEEELEDVSINIPLTFAIQVSLFSIYEYWGLKPDVVLGHSIGELAASHISGMLNLEDAVKSMYHYSRLVQSTAGHVGMAVINYPKEMAEELISNYESLEIVGYNAPTSTNIAGERSDIDRIVKEITNKGGKAALIQVHVAAHSSFMDKIMPEMEESIGKLNALPPRTPFFSTSLNKYVHESNLDGSYWANSIRNPVLFSQAIQKLLSEGVNLFLELSAHPVLRFYLNKIFILNQSNAVALYSLNREETDTIAIQNLLSALYLNGFDVNWEHIYSKYQSSLINQTVSLSKGESFILPFSAKSEYSLVEYAKKYINFFQTEVGDSQKELFDVCCTASIRRSHFPLRLAFSGTNKQEIISQLQEVVDSADDFEASENLQKNEGKIAFVFPGQGAQWIGMGRGLFEKEEIFRESILESNRVFSKYVGWNLESILLNGTASDFSQLDIIQPALFAIQVALAELWISWGIKPDGLVGHSMGEIASAYISGSISLDSAINVICTRSRLMKEMSGKGAMLATDFTLEEAQQISNEYDGEISVAVNNSKSSTVLSGNKKSILELLSKLEKTERFARLVKVDVASHSYQMEEVKGKLYQALLPVNPQKGHTSIYSTVRDSILDGSELDANYWTENLRNTVQFGNAITKMAEDGFTTFIEISPHPVLSMAIKENLDGISDFLVLPSLLRDLPEQETIIKQLAELYTYGYDPNWKAFYPSTNRFVELPTYPWHREHYEIEDNSEEFEISQKSPLLGRKIRIADSDTNHYWEVNLNTNRLPFLKDHLIKGKFMLPVSIYFEMIHEAVNDLFPNNETFAVENPSFTQRIEIFEKESIQLQLKVKIMQPQLLSVNFYYLPSEDANWLECASCTVKDLVDKDELEDAEDLDVNLLSRHNAKEIMTKEDFYGAYQKLNINYGKYFQCVSQVLEFGNDLFLKLKPDERIVHTSGRYGIHPSLMDGCFQALLLTIPKEKQGVGFKVTSIRRATFLRKPNYGEPIWVHLKSRRGYESEKKHIIADIVLFSEQNEIICVIKRLKLQEFSYAHHVYDTGQNLSVARIRQSEEDLGIPESVKVELLRTVNMQKQPDKLKLEGMGLKQLENIIKAKVAQIIKANKSRIGLKQDFKNLGIDSLMGISLAKELSRDFGIEMQATLFYNHTNIKQLSQYIFENLEQGSTTEIETQAVWEEASSNQLHQKEATIEESVEQLTEEQLLLELEKELEGLF
ncbi:MAG: acyl transferase domain-containing protein [Bacteroidia bacterium]|jgi:acyl transferase domain-containing protein